MLGKYKVLKNLGVGGTAKVVLGIDPESGEKVALKILNKDYVKEKFDNIQEEINILCELDHPNIVKIFDV